MSSTGAHRSWRAPGWLPLLIGLPLLVLAGACSRSESSEQQAPSASETRRAAPSADAAAPTGAELGLPGAASPSAAVAQPEATKEAYVRELRSLHAEVDAANSPPTRRAALDRIARVYGEPTGLAPSALGPLRQDLASRAARLALALDRPVDARAWAERGLAESEGQPFFRANLLVDLADAERALGDTEQAQRHLSEALGLNRELLERELAEP